MLCKVEMHSVSENPKVTSYQSYDILVAITRKTGAEVGLRDTWTLYL